MAVYEWVYSGDDVDSNLGDGRVMAIWGSMWDTTMVAGKGENFQNLDF